MAFIVYPRGTQVPSQILNAMKLRMIAMIPKPMRIFVSIQWYTTAGSNFVVKSVANEFTAVLILF